MGKICEEHQSERFMTNTLIGSKFMYDGIFYRKTGESSFEAIPNIIKCPSSAPIVQLIDTLY